LGQHRPLAGGAQVQAVAQPFQLPQLIQVQGASGDDAVVQQRQGQGLELVTVGALALDDIQLTLDQQEDQQQMDLVRHQPVDRLRQVLVDGLGCGLVFDQGLDQTDQLVAVQLGCCLILLSPPAHQAHGKQITLPHDPQKLLSLGGFQPLAQRRAHQLAVGLLWQRTVAGGETLE